MGNNNTYLENPLFLILLIIIPLLILWWIFNNKKIKSYIVLPFNISGLSSDKNNILARFYPILFALRLLGIVFIIYALSRPRSVDISSIKKSSYGIDIVMAIDVSGSMLAKDLSPNRLEALKGVALDFVSNRNNDRIGIVSYAGESFTVCPLTSDLTIVRNSIKDMSYGLLEDGTAIGMGLGTAISRIKDSKAKSKVIILLTDGVNNSGEISPMTATGIAKELDIKVYTIAIGTNGFAEMPYAVTREGKMLFKEMKVEVDEELMKKIAEETGGKYYRAVDNYSLKNIYNQIDQLEKTKLEDLKYYSYDEKFRIYTLIALSIFLIEIILKLTLFRGFV